MSKNSEFVPDGWYDDYPDTPRFRFGGGQQRLIYDRKKMEREKEKDRRAAGKGSGSHPNEREQDLFDQ